MRGTQAAAAAAATDALRMPQEDGFYVKRGQTLALGGGEEEGGRGERRCASQRLGRRWPWRRFPHRHTHTHTHPGGGRTDTP